MNANLPQFTSLTFLSLRDKNRFIDPILVFRQVEKKLWTPISFEILSIAESMIRFVVYSGGFPVLNFFPHKTKGINKSHFEIDQREAWPASPSNRSSIN